jgi:hypothetical protein
VGVCLYVGVCMCAFCNVCVLVIRILALFGYPDWGLPALFLSCKANANVKLAKTGHGPHSSQLVVICVFYFSCVVPCIVRV